MMNGIETLSLTWRTLVDHLEDEIKRAQRELEDPAGSLPERQSDILRGEIKRMRAILALADAPPEKRGAPGVGPDAR